MRTLITLILLTSSLFANAHYYEFKPSWKNFGRIKSAKDITIKKRNVLSKKRGYQTKKKAIRVVVDGSIASCSGMTFREIFPKFRKKIISCSSSELIISLEYLRTQACDQEMIMDNKKFNYILPKECDFSVESGKVTMFYQY